MFLYFGWFGFCGGEFGGGFGGGGGGGFWLINLFRIEVVVDMFYLVY